MSTLLITTLLHKIPYQSENLKPTRHVRPPTYLQNYHCNLLSNTIPILEATAPNSSSQCKYPLSSFLSYDVLSLAHKHFTLHLSAISEPHSYESAICDANWKDAIQTELTALIKTYTWTLVPLPSHKKAIGCKWVFKLKMHANGTGEKYKACLVVKPCGQNDNNSSANGYCCCP